MMIIDYDKVKDTLFGDCFLNAVTKSKTLGTNSKPLDVKLTLNNIELPLLETFADFEKQTDRMVKEKALELINEELYDIRDTVSEMFKEVEEKIRKRLNLPKEDNY
jgi:hypothetical protein